MSSGKQEAEYRREEIIVDSVRLFRQWEDVGSKRQWKEGTSVWRTSVQEWGLQSEGLHRNPLGKTQASVSSFVKWSSLICCKDRSEEKDKSRKKNNRMPSTESNLS